MTTLNKLLDKARKACPRDSDYSLSQELGLSRMAVSRWRNGARISQTELAKIIDMAQADPALAVQVLAEQESSPEEHRMWSAVWDRLSPVTTVIGAMVLAIGMMPATGRTKSLDIQWLAQLDRAYSVYYVRTSLAADYLTAPLSSCSSRLNGTSGGGLAVAG
ncbi:DUF3693 domain-containing protein [Xanthomonas arboricola]|uniref:DUF3693 domain-containing protein n=1 Tax=Xanthomonas arboricola TaxID=56448 RepID=UPI000CEDA9DB|nr:DUF3693 domain-containing protein [Xanthomonas arboricola]PPT53121.1 hypothetical protein XarbCFBP8147_04420 [Xanthomonas arboricola]